MRDAFPPPIVVVEIVYVLSAWKRCCAGMVRHIMGLDAKVWLQHFFNTTGNVIRKERKLVSRHALFFVFLRTCVRR